MQLFLCLWLSLTAVLAANLGMESLVVGGQRLAFLFAGICFTNLTFAALLAYNETKRLEYHE